MVPRTSYALEVRDICNTWMTTNASEVRIPRVCHMLPEQHPAHIPCRCCEHDARFISIRVAKAIYNAPEARITRVALGVRSAGEVRFLHGLLLVSTVCAQLVSRTSAEDGRKVYPWITRRPSICYWTDTKKAFKLWRYRQVAPRLKTLIFCTRSKIILQYPKWGRVDCAAIPIDTV
jgi:hypothetical protein